MYFLASLLGNVISIFRSNLPALVNASSKFYYKLVAAKTMTFSVDEKPSISINN